jgi:hypothetical protein
VKKQLFHWFIGVNSRHFRIVIVTLFPSQFNAQFCLIRLQKAKKIEDGRSFRQKADDGHNIDRKA